MGLVKKGVFEERNRKYNYSSTRSGSLYKEYGVFHVVYGENVDSTCRVCGSADETVAHIVAECQKLVQKEYKQVRHDHVTNVIHRKLCKKWVFEKSDQWYTHKPEKVLESEECKIL